MTEAHALATSVLRRLSTLPGVRGLHEYTTLTRRAASLVESGILDREFYTAQSGVHFTDDRSAAQHLLTIGIENGWSPHPLYQEHWYARSTGQPHGNRLLSMLFGGEPLASTSPFFDAAAFARTCRSSEHEVPGTTRQALEAFLAQAEGGTELPVVEEALGRPTLAEARADAIARAGEQRRRRMTALQPFSPEWDSQREETFIEGFAGGASSSGELVSVVMPVRDRADLVEAAVRSVIEQQYHDWELIVIDDGSTDGTFAVLESLAAEDERIRPIRQDAGGVSAARNRGIQASVGRYVAFLDSDNRWLPEMLRYSVAALQAPDTRSVHAGVRFEDGRGHTMYLAAEGSREQLLDDQNFIDLNTFVVERDLLEQVGGFDTSLRRWVDHDLFIRLAEYSRSRLLPFIGVAYAHTNTHERISTRESAGWQQVVRQKHLIDWGQVRADIPGRRSDLVSILIAAHDDVDATVRALRSVVDAAGPIALEIIVLDNGSPDGVLEALSAICCGTAQVVVIRQSRDAHAALGLNLAFTASSGSRVVFLDHRVQVERGWLEPLLALLATPDIVGVGPVVEYADRSLRTAGWLTNGDRIPPSRFLAGHPAEDAERARRVSPTSLSLDAMLISASDVAAADGLDPLFVDDYADLDLALRIRGDGSRRWVTEPNSRVVHHAPWSDAQIDANSADLRTFRERWRGRIPRVVVSAYEDAGLHVDGFEAGPDLLGAFVRAAAPRVVEIERGTPSADLPCGRLRWAIKTAAPIGSLGDRWGDTIFAHDLAAALRHIGHDVIVDRRERHRNPLDCIEDVVLTIRGLDAVVPNPRAINILWVISHPELVTDQELHSYDLVYGASPGWAERTSARTGVPVLPLLQATDPARFHPDEARHGEGEPVFVGSTRGVRRPVVEAAILAGHPPLVYGPGWDGLVAAERHISEQVAPEDVGAVYRAARVVLNDHWPDMAREGFISNRVFDAVASGTPVISDEVAGLESIFGASVLVVHGPDDIATLLDGASSLPSRETVLEIADTVAREHSFAARASTLSEAVHDFRQRAAGSLS